MALVSGVPLAGLVSVFLSNPLVAQSRPNMMMRLALVLSVVVLAVALREMAAMAEEAGSLWTARK